MFSEIKVGLAYKVDDKFIPHFPGKCVCVCEKISFEEANRHVIHVFSLYVCFLRGSNHEILEKMDVQFISSFIFSSFHTF